MTNMAAASADQAFFGGVATLGSFVGVSMVVIIAVALRNRRYAKRKMAIMADQLT